MPSVKAHPLPCPFCNSPTYNFSQYTKHLQIFHEHEKKFKVNCLDPDCSQTFTRVTPYKRDNQRNHAIKQFFDFPSITSSPRLAHSNITNTTEKPQCELTEEAESAGSNCGESQENMAEDFKKHFAHYLLSVKERHMLPDNLQRALISELEFLLNVSGNTFKQMIDKCFLEENGYNPRNSETYKNLMAQETLFDEEINAVNSKFKLKNYVISNFPYVKPCAYYLSFHDRDSIYHYVPIIDMLKAILSRTDFQKHVQNNEHSCHHPNVLYDT